MAPEWQGVVGVLVVALRMVVSHIIGNASAGKLRELRRLAASLICRRPEGPAKELAPYGFPQVAPASVGLIPRPVSMSKCDIAMR